MNEDIIKYDEKIFTPVGLKLPTGLSFDECENLGRKLRYINNTCLWWWGDWLLYIEANHGDKYTQALEESDYKYGTLRDAKWVCNQFNLSCRHDKLPFGFHREIADIKDNVLREHLLTKCEEEGWTRKELRENIKNYNRSLLAENGKNKPINIDFRFGDFEEVFADIPDNSVDCIITDPPYPIEFIECWSKLSHFAKRVLKENGFCIAYSGQMNLPEVIKRMSENLDYYWTFSLSHTGIKQLINPRNIFCGWKPILIFQNKFKRNDIIIEDTIIGSGREKDGHEWQQAESELTSLIEHFSNVGDLIIDPFAGHGTTLVAAHKMDRNVKGAEIDEITYNIAKNRINEQFAI
jgi:DNA modification methylase